MHRELCETDADAAADVDQWSELEPVLCQLDDHSVHHRSTDVLEPTESVMPADDRRTGRGSRAGCAAPAHRGRCVESFASVRVPRGLRIMVA